MASGVPLAHRAVVTDRHSKVSTLQLQTSIIFLGFFIDDTAPEKPQSFCLLVSPLDTQPCHAGWLSEATRTLRNAGASPRDGDR